MNEQLRTLLTAAARAPSGDNSQPWVFAVDAPKQAIALDVDPQRDPSPMNAGQRMARISVGAALENLVQTAAHNGWPIELVQDRSHAAVVLVHLGGGGAGTVHPAIHARATNRRRYDGRPLPPHVMAHLEKATAGSGAVRIRWVTDRERLPALGEAIGRADALMFGQSTMRQAFLANVRFDADVNAEVEEGLSLASLELARADRVALRLMRRAPEFLFRCSGCLRVLSAHARRLITTASGLCLVGADDDREETDIEVGRAMQRAWLALVAAGLTAQPMMSWPVLENMSTQGNSALTAALGRSEVMALRAQMQSLLPELEAGRLAFLLRFGYAQPPSGRTGRRPLAAMMRPTICSTHRMSV